MASPIPILLYHSIDTDCAPDYQRWTVRPDIFDAQMRVLRDAGYNMITVSGLIVHLAGGVGLSQPVAVVTFDDGLRDFLTGAMPVLSRHNIPATLYVTSGYVGQTSAWLAPLGEGSRKMLDWPELRSLAAAGIEIGGHTVSHPALDVLPAAKSHAEITGCKRHIEDGIGAAIRSFAYPHGYASRVTRNLVQNAGFRSACRVRHAFSSADENPYALSRIIMTNDVTPRHLLELLSNPSLPVAPPTDYLLSYGWRAYRQVKHVARDLSRRAASSQLPT